MNVLVSEVYFYYFDISNKDRINKILYDTKDKIKLFVDNEYTLSCIIDIYIKETGNTVVSEYEFARLRLLEAKERENSTYIDADDFFYCVDELDDAYTYYSDTVQKYHDKYGKIYFKNNFTL